MDQQLNERHTVHRLLDRALDDVTFPTVDPVGAVRAKAAERRLRRRNTRILSAVAGAVLILLAAATGPGLLGDRTPPPPSGVEQPKPADPFYPVGTLLPPGSTGLHRAVLPKWGQPASPTPWPTISLVTPVRDDHRSTRITIYTFQRDGHPVDLRVFTYDPSRYPEDPRPDLGLPGCTDYPDTTCHLTVRPDGSHSIVGRQGPTPVGDQGTWHSASVNASVYYPDQRRVWLMAYSAFDSPERITTPPPVSEAELQAMAESQDWFAPGSVG